MHARATVKQLWETYKARILPELDLQNSGSNSEDPFDLWMADLDDPNDTSPYADEYDDYCSAKRDPRCTNPFIWWQCQLDSSPQLSRMALDLLSIPGMSAAVERVFSSTKLMLLDSRNRLGAMHIEEAECLRSWQKSGLVVL